MTRQPPLGLGYSPCPNDTFMFHALVHGQVPDCTLSFRVAMDDVEALNQRAIGGLEDAPLEFSKVSVAALPWMADRYTLLRAGAALGRGCGPLVVAREQAPLAHLAGRRVAIPGTRTTAYLLLRIFAPRDLVPVPMRFDRILPAVAAGEVDAGLIIHESRFTYTAHGLTALSDLGELWEADTGLPLPLGAIVAQRALPPGVVDQMERGLAQSVQLAFDHPERSWPYVREHAQELSEAVCRDHIGLYVNAFSADLGDEGRTAIDALLARGREAGALPPDAPSPWR